MEVVERLKCGGGGGGGGGGGFVTVMNCQRRQDGVWMCEVCEEAPAAVTCKADAAALCLRCDADIHSANPLARRHHRMRIDEGFFYDESAESDQTVWRGEDEMSGFLHLVKCGSVGDGDGIPWMSAAAFNYPAQTMNIFDDRSMDGLQISSSISDIGVVPEGKCVSDVSVVVPDGKCFSEISVMVAGSGKVDRNDREARVLRYREKRKRRKFQKTIRYASRKAYAESRPRIKGRFAKRSGGHAQSELFQDFQCGVVPSF